MDRFKITRCFEYGVPFCQPSICIVMCNLFSKLTMIKCIDYKYFNITYVNIVKHLISFMWCMWTLMKCFFYGSQYLSLNILFLFVTAFYPTMVSYLQNKLFFLKTDFYSGRIGFIFLRPIMFGFLRSHFVCFQQQG